MEETIKNNQQTAEAECQGEPAAGADSQEKRDAAASQADSQAGAAAEAADAAQADAENADGNPGGDAEEDPAGAEAADGQGKEKKGFFRKKDKKDPKDEKIEDLTDRLRRSMAEFDNYRKRTDKEKAAMYEVGAKDIIEKILPVVDNFERGLAAIPEDAKGSPFAEGMEKIYKQFVKTLEDIGVTPIEAVGKEFNPNFHNAVMHIDDENFGENVVSMELQKGYMYRDSVVRHSMVQVAN